MATAITVIDPCGHKSECFSFCAHNLALGQGRGFFTQYVFFVAFLMKGDFVLFFVKFFTKEDFQMKKITSLLLALMLSLTLAFVTSCNETEAPESSSSSSTASSVVDSSSNDSGNGNDNSSDNSEIPADGLWKDATYRCDTDLGAGNTAITLVVEIDGKSINFNIKTNKTVLSDALLEVGIIEGHEDTYGLYIDRVNGVLADWSIDQTYWALYINGEYAMTGASSTDVVNGTTYKLSREG